MMLVCLPPGMRFRLIRTGEFFRHTGQWDGPKHHRIVVVADSGRVGTLNRQCKVKPCIGAV